MSDQVRTRDEGSAAAALVAGDPAFAALESSGAPILALTGDPLRIVHLNASAAAVFGSDPDAVCARLLQGPDPSAARMVEVIKSVRQGGAPRLERLRLSFGPIAQTVTILCRRLEAKGAAPVYALAALGVRPAVAAARALSRAEAPAPTSEPPAPEEAPPRPESVEQMRARLIERAGAAHPRFLWKSDAAHRLVEASPALAAAVGARCADIVGRPAAEVARELALGPRFAHAFDSPHSWSGVDALWPIDDGAAEAPVTFGAFPLFDAAQNFAGFQGFGVLRLDAATPRGANAPPLTLRAPPVSPPPTAVAPAPGNVVPLRPAPEPARPEAPAQALTPEERDAFDDIARALGSVAAPPATPAPDARGLMAFVEQAVAAPEADAAPAEKRDAPLSALLDVLPVGVLVARGSEARYANRTLLDYLGYADLAALQAGGGVARLFSGARPDSAAPSGPVALRASDGENLEVDAHFQMLDWGGEAATLVTVRRRVETPAAALADCASALDANPDAIALLDGARRLLFANDALRRMTGFGDSFLLGREAASLLLDEDAAALRALVEGAAPAEDAAPLRLKTRDGAPLPVRASLEPVSGRGEAAYCLVLRDAAPQLRALAAVDEARAEAERVSAAKSEFLARVSHEIRTPLNAILGFAEVMMEERFGPIGSERYREYLKDVHASGAHVLSIVNDLLDLSKIEAGKMELNFERVDANAVVAECVSIMQAQANQGRVIIRLSLAPRLPRLRADKRSLRQILLNLLSNAVKFNEAGGQVIVSSALTDRGFVVLRVKDTGVGMSEAEVALALEPFKQLPGPNRARGTGLGLPVTKALIEANHASFTIRSRKNEGTLVEIAFPPPQVIAAE